MFINYNKLVLFMIIIAGPMGQSNSNANSSIKQTYAPRSRRSYYNKLFTFLTFCQLFDINTNGVSEDNAIAFLEVLAASGITCSTILSYIC